MHNQTSRAREETFKVSKRVRELHRLMDKYEGTILRVWNDCMAQHPEMDDLAIVVSTEGAAGMERSNLNQDTFVEHGMQLERFREVFTTPAGQIEPRRPNRECVWIILIELRAALRYCLPTRKLDA
jgi:hypothetical protein